MSALQIVVDGYAVGYENTPEVVACAREASAELDELRARAEAAEARALSAEDFWHRAEAERDEQREAARLAFKHRKQVEAERDEQARQLDKARNVISAYRRLPTGPKGYTSYPLFDLHNAADEWLAANPAPQEQT